MKGDWPGTVIIRTHVGCGLVRSLAAGELGCVILNIHFTGSWSPEGFWLSSFK